MQRRFRAPLRILLGLLAACGSGATSGTSPAPTTAVTVQRVILVSIDGLRADALGGMSVLSGLAARGAYTDAMRTVVPSMTVPGHLSMLTGRDVTTLGIVDNALGATAALKLVVSGATTVFAWAKDAGMHTEAVAGALLIPASSRADAQALFGLDTLVAASLDADSVVPQAIAIARRTNAPAILFVHFSDADLAGHASGWLTSGTGGSLVLGAAYLQAVAHVDAALGRLYASVASDVAAGTTAFIVTADHGGGAGEGCVPGIPAVRQHCTASPEDVTVPFVLVSLGVRAARIQSGASITSVAATVAKLLGVTRPARTAAPLAY